MTIKQRGTMKGGKQGDRKEGQGKAAGVNMSKVHGI